MHLLIENKSLDKMVLEIIWVFWSVAMGSVDFMFSQMIVRVLVDLEQVLHCSATTLAQGIAVFFYSLFNFMSQVSYFDDELNYGGGFITKLTVKFFLQSHILKENLYILDSNY